MVIRSQLQHSPSFGLSANPSGFVDGNALSNTADSSGYPGNGDWKQRDLVIVFELSLCFAFEDNFVLEVYL